LTLSLSLGVFLSALIVPLVNLLDVDAKLISNNFLDVLGPYLSLLIVLLQLLSKSLLLLPGEWCFLKGRRFAFDCASLCSKLL